MTHYGIYIPASEQWLVGGDGVVFSTPCLAVALEQHRLWRLMGRAGGEGWSDGEVRPFVAHGVHEPAP